MFTEENISLVLFAAHSGEQFNQYLPYLLIARRVDRRRVSRDRIASGGRAEAKSRWSLWEWLVYCATLVSVGILAATSFGGC
jgi:hypothetical protein